jgi:pyruvate dehydrogenase E2 component (dihydrolipoamide acetyltransferase)
MIWEVRMPRLDEDMEEGTINRWLINEGDPVNKGEHIVEVETQKVNYKIEAPGSGILRLILMHKGDTVPVNMIIAVIADAEGDISKYRAPAIASETGKVTPLAASSESATTNAPPASAAETRVSISPIAKKLAAEKGLDISKIQGIGPGGRITKEDVLNFKPEEIAPAAKAATRKISQTLPYSGVRKTIATRLSESWHNSPRAENIISVDVTELTRIREKNKSVWEKQYGIRPSLNDVIIAATAAALKAYPIVNSSLSLQKGKIEIYEDINISIAVAYEKGLITPVLRNAAARNIFEIAKESRRLAELVRKGEHTSDIIAESTFTITNLGMYDVDIFIPIINPPECAILAVGKVDKKPVFFNDAIAIRSMMSLCLAYDHRILDGVVAALFLQTIKGVLEDPSRVLLQDR